MADYLMRVAAAGANVAPPAQPPRAASLPLPQIRSKAIVPPTGSLSDFTSAHSDEVYFGGLRDDTSSLPNRVPKDREATSALNQSNSFSADQFQSPQVATDLLTPVDKIASARNHASELSSSRQIASRADLSVLQPALEPNQSLRPVPGVSSTPSEPAGNSALLQDSAFLPQAISRIETTVPKSSPTIHTPAVVEKNEASQDLVRVPRIARPAVADDIPSKLFDVPISVSVRMPKGLRPSGSQEGLEKPPIDSIRPMLPSSDSNSATLDERFRGEVGSDAVSRELSGVKESSEALPSPLKQENTQSLVPRPSKQNVQSMFQALDDDANVQPSTTSPRPVNDPIPMERSFPFPRDLNHVAGKQGSPQRSEPRQSRLTIGRVDVNVHVEAPARPIFAASPPRQVESRDSNNLDEGQFDRFQLRY